MTHTFGPSKPKTITSALRHQCRNVIQFQIIIILITTFHSVRVTNKPQSVSNAAYNLPGTHCSYSATGIRNLATQQTWLDCFLGFVSLAVQRLPKFFIPTFPVLRFLLPRSRHLNTQHCIYMSLQKLTTTVKLCTACIFTVNCSAPAA